MEANRKTCWLFEPDHVENWAYSNAVFSKEECEKIIAAGEKAGLEIGRVTANNTVLAEMRDSQISWFHPNEDTGWIFSRLAAAVTKLNKDFFKFDLYGMTEGLQFTRYDSPSSFYARHIDRGFYTQTRKISISVQLSAPEDYEGGDLQLHYQPSPVTAPKDQGTLVMFPSYTLHEVTPMTKGTRYSLVCWVSGPPFK